MKIFEMTPKMTKSFSDFLRFHAIFVKFSTNFVDTNVENVQQGTNLLCNSLL